jgi:crossover junction endodeoxyribonuclease RuvC
MVNAAELARLIRQSAPGCAYLERLNAMPGQGVTSMFSMGQSLGVVLGILAALDIPTTTIPPRTWQKALDVPQGKDGSRYRAAQLFPAHAAKFARVKDDGRSDAALIAAYGASR